MMPQEAITRIDGLIANEKLFIKISTMGEIDHSKNIEALETAKQALEKQIPKKPLKEYGGTYRCPNCQMKHFNPEWVGTKYCDCGQALDLGDE